MDSQVTQFPHGRVFLPRIHFYEINDQSWWPPFLRAKIQDILVIGWINKFPLIQPLAPCAVAVQTLSSLLQNSISEYIYIDFASGSGGPTPYIEHELNSNLRAEGKEEVQFVLTDISPNVPVWESLCKKSDNLSYVPESVDATNAPDADTLLRGIAAGKNKKTKKKKIMRLFSLAFHHFDDTLATQVLKNTIETSDGFCIFELQSRNLSSFVIITLLWPLALLTTPYYFGNSPIHLIFTYLIPLIPFVWVFDGYISALRSRTPQEIQDLMKSSGVEKEELMKWEVRAGRTCHTWPIGWFYWVVGTKKS